MSAQQDRGMASEAKEKAQQLAKDTQDKVEQQMQSGVQRGKNQAARTIGSLGQSLRSSSQQLRQQDQATMGGYMERAADKMDQLADYLQRTDTAELTRRAEGFARREPALFLGGMFLAGFLGARFLKSSRHDEERDFGSAMRGAGSYGERSYRGERFAGGMSDREVPTPAPRRDWEVAPKTTASSSSVPVPDVGRSPGSTSSGSTSSGSTSSRSTSSGSTSSGSTSPGSTPRGQPPESGRS
ncbi:MAG TPA: hypothetical protein VFS05_00340 [Gemmatimonadaceae bacterium]|nr:hypothetical protein [Gemmatimonadaceae bacterium]